MGKKLFIVSAALILLLVAGFTIYRVVQKKQEAKTASAKKSGVKIRPVPIEAVPVVRKDLRDLRVFTGTLSPWSSYDVAPKITGRLLELHYSIGDRIAPGAVIAKVDDEEYRQTLLQKQAELEVARANLKEAGVNRDLKFKEYKRLQELHRKKIVSDVQFEAADSSFLAQEAVYKMKQAEVRRCESALRTAEIKVNDAIIRADWAKDASPRFVGERFRDAGALLAINEAILSVIEIDRLKADIYVIERDYPQLRAKQTAEITTDAYPGQTFVGKIDKISQLLVENSRQARVQLEIPNRDFRLKPGMFVRVQVEFSAAPGSICVPRSALVRRDGKIGVFHVLPVRGKVQFIPVETGIVQGDYVAIRTPRLEGLVATLGNHLLSDGSDVTIPGMKKKSGSAQ